MAHATGDPPDVVATIIDAYVDLGLDTIALYDHDARVLEIARLTQQDREVVDRAVRAVIGLSRAERG